MTAGGLSASRPSVEGRGDVVVSLQVMSPPGCWLRSWSGVVAKTPQRGLRVLGLLSSRVRGVRSGFWLVWGFFRCLIGCVQRGGSPMVV